MSDLKDKFPFRMTHYENSSTFFDYITEGGVIYEDFSGKLQIAGKKTPKNDIKRILFFDRYKMMDEEGAKIQRVVQRFYNHTN